MADCLQELWEILETTVETVEKFWDEVDEVVEEIVDEVETVILTELDHFTEEMDQFVEEVIYPFLDLKVQDEPDWQVDEDLETAITYHVDPINANKPACVGCQHYHGQVYGGNLLVCAMHPYGWETNHCPDWENFTDH